VHLRRIWTIERGHPAARHSEDAAMTSTPTAGNVVAVVGRIAFADILSNLPSGSDVMRASGEQWYSDIDSDEFAFFILARPYPAGVTVAEDSPGIVLTRGHGDFYIRRAGDTVETTYRVRNAGDNP
jgi:hypothetical protein